MGDVKRWTVTYTKHMKQKRKVYQDGALELYGSCEKIMLYDDCGKLLGSRSVKKDEVIESGGTVAFDTNLVDIGELEGTCKPLKDLNIQRENIPIEKTKTQRQKASHNSSENKRAEMPNSGASQSRPNVIKKIGTEHKRDEFHNYRAIQSRKDATQTGNKQIGLQNSLTPRNQPNAVQAPREWHAMYTTQITQKSKKYHDGTLRLLFCGSYQRQVMLYDDCGKLLGSRFLKKDELVESGGTLTFDTHLVDIGDPEENDKPLVDLNVQGDKPSNGKTGILEQKVRHNYSVENKTAKLQNNEAPLNIGREWHAMYTTQITRKAKKYHDGTLRLLFCGSYQKQVMLYDDCGKLLGSRFLKKDEVVESGGTLAFDTHLIDIGDPEENDMPLVDLNVQGDKPSNGKTWMLGQKVRHNSSVENMTVKLQNNEAPLNIGRGSLQNNDSSGKVMCSYSSRSNIDRSTSSGRAPRNELLRDGSSVACQILSVLKKPVAQEGRDSVNLQMEQTCVSQSSGLLQSGHQGKGQNASGMGSSKVDAENKCDDDTQNFSRGNSTQIGPSRSNFSQPKETQEIPSLGFTNLIDPEYKQKLRPDKSSASTIAFPRMAALDFSQPKLDMEHSDRDIIDLTSITGVPEISTCDSPEINQIHCTIPESESCAINHGDTSRARLSCLSECMQVEEYFALTCFERKHHLDDSTCNPLKEGNSTNDRSMLPESSYNGMWVLEDVKDENLKQIQCSEVFVDNVEPDAQACEEAFLLGSSSSLGGPACAVANAERESSEELKSLSEKGANMDDIPSFDLGI